MQYQTVPKTDAQPLQLKIKEGMTCLQTKQYDKAAAIYKSVVKKLPKSPELQNLLGTAYQGQQRYGKAADCFRKSLKLTGQNSATLISLARCQFLAGESAEKVLDTLDAAVALDPERMETVALKVDVMVKAGRYADAFELIKRHAATDTPDIVFLRYCVSAFAKVEQRKAACAFLNRMIELDPDTVTHYADRAWLRISDEDYFTCFDELSQALLRFPADLNLSLLFSELLLRLSRHHEALKYIEYYTKNVPDSGMGHLIHAHILNQLERYDEAYDAIVLAEEHRAEKAEQLKWIKSNIELARGNLKEGWELHPARFHEKGAKWWDYPAPLWNGEDLTDKAILIWSDQGLGDTIKSTTMLSDLKQMAGKVILETNPRFVPFFSQALEGIECRRIGGSPGQNSAPQDDPDRDYDFVSNTTDIARFLRPSLASFDKLRCPSIRFDREKSLGFMERLPGAADKPVIGLCWRSKKMEAYRARYYMTAEQMCAIVESEDAVFLNLQYLAHPPELKALSSVPGRAFHHFEDVDLYNDLGSVASLIAICDVVISANTNIADLAGVMDVPCVRFGGTSVPLTLGKDYVPWSPSVTFVRVDERELAHHMIPTILEKTHGYLKDVFPQAKKKRLAI
ncbi:tetratricopeptide repeat protein [Roseibium aggregatum]|uniref:Tetratricopeptide repeat protein n=1 Tax=Roseibium aggregatum TaxID=187304 RepID=A0A939J4P0_9HYPH|nr:tetratricopeptide repeat protein [Roseibium aggregatum]MBN9670904.1 tetratricopeptide repeat protein [Roseibium aggregatum]